MAGMEGKELARPDQTFLPEPGAIIFDANWTLDDFARAWRTLDSRAAWIKGDMARYVADRWGTAGGVGVLAEKLGENVNTLRSYRRVAEAWPEDARRLEVPWSVHQVLASQEDRAELLKKRPKMTVEKARALVQSRNCQPSLEEARATAIAAAKVAGVEPVTAEPDPVAVAGRLAAAEPVAVAAEPEPVATCPHHVCPVCGHEHPSR
jgi:hypothetical protein